MCGARIVGLSVQCLRARHSVCDVQEYRYCRLLFHRGHCSLVTIMYSKRHKIGYHCETVTSNDMLIICRHNLYRCIFNRQFQGYIVKQPNKNCIIVIFYKSIQVGIQNRVARETSVRPILGGLQFLNIYCSDKTDQRLFTHSLLYYRRCQQTR